MTETRQPYMVILQGPNGEPLITMPLPRLSAADLETIRAGAIHIQYAHAELSQLVMRLLAEYEELRRDSAGSGC